MNFFFVVFLFFSSLLDSLAVPCSGRHGICHWINIAKGKPATQSTTLPQANPYCDPRQKFCPPNSADVAVDGNTSNLYNEGSCTHTGLPPSSTEWWSVNVGPGHLIHYIELYLVTNPGNRGRLNPLFEIFVDDELCFRYNSTIPVTKIYDITCDKPILGSNITFSLPPVSVPRILNLCEIEVYECAAKYFDPVTECTKQCNCRTTSEICDKEIGTCDSGCPDGFYEEAGCQRGCNNGEYGLNCSQKCGKCKFGIPCDKTSGVCPGACETHWKGAKCDGCMNNWWGSDCKSQCGQCLGGAICNKTSGFCPLGCAANWKGERCDECIDGKWGADCSNDCGNCIGGSCNKTDGTCKCLAHWAAPLCTDCIGGYYNENCSAICGKCTEGSACNSTTGICEFGCEGNYLEDLCQECVGGWFGQSCNLQCNCRDRTEECDKKNGLCQSGCVDGKKLPNCLKDCDGGTYGTNCSSVCGHCRGGQACDEVNGNCRNGCVSTFQGKKCEECIDGKHGMKCGETCGKCKNKDICDKRTGNCPRGCIVGYKAGYCTQECADGTYGEDCKKKCGSCADGGACNKISGACPLQCEEGWETILCNKQVAPAPAKSSMVFVAVGIGCAVLFLLFIIVIIVIFRRHAAKKETRTRLREEYHGNNSLGREITAIDNHGSVYNVNPALDLSDDFDDDTDDDNNFEEERGTINMDNVYVNNVMMDMDAADLRYCIDKKTNKDEFSTEFGMLPKGLIKKHEEGTMPYNKKKNRFLAIYPYDDTRVILPILPGDESSTYINANYIQGYRKARPYIATQGCLPHTINDFWRMIWHVRARRIVMLTSLAEGGKTKCNQYWPDFEKKMLFHIYQITNIHEDKRSDYIIRTFIMADSQTGEKREIIQYHFTSWPDHGVPSVPALLYFYRLVIMAGLPDEGQLVTHCSAGVGRTGTFLGLDAMIEQASVENKVNIFNYVSAMRDDRVNMVQTKCQYIFLHHVLLEALLTQNTFYTTPRFEEIYNNGVPLGSDVEKQLRKEHQNLLMLRKHLTPDLTKAALSIENITKNRWTDRYLPSDEHRLFLSTPVKGTTSYINAVTIPSIIESYGFLTTQMPLEETVVDFWRMVYGMDVQCIVSADPYVAQNGLPDFGIYWPEENEELLVSPFKIRCTNVSMIAEEVFEYNLTFKLQTRNDISEERVVKLYLLNCWSKEWLVPRNISPILAVLETVTHNIHAPVVFQCLNGISRSGLLSAAANVILRLKLDKEIDIFSIIRQIQMVVPESISTFEQYKFCYDIATRCLDSMKVYSNL